MKSQDDRKFEKTVRALLSTPPKPHPKAAKKEGKKPQEQARVAGVAKPK